MATPYAGTDITSDDKLWALLSWLLAPIVPIIVLLMEEKKARPFIKYHAINALLFNLIVVLLLGSITVGCIATIGVIAEIYFAIKAYQGEWVKVPVLTDLAKGQGWIV
jgi:uncharacterized membrane protein